MRMPRKPRELQDGAYYHILTRGNDKKIIFHGPEDYSIFLNILKKYLNCCQISVFHFCLMPNHLHLLVQARKADDLPRLMQGLLQTYGSYFRKINSATGFVFQNRYKSLLIKKESYLLECARYIERNPLRAGLADDLFKYPWSSFMSYVCDANMKSEIVRSFNPLYLNLSNTVEGRKRAYRDYVLEERPYEKIIDLALKLK